jgi:23S rRNA pseudouridine955/2504/2580 synthase
MYLHAWRLQFKHPATDERLTVWAKLPLALSGFSGTNPAEPPLPHKP